MACRVCRREDGSIDTSAFKIIYVAPMKVRHFLFFQRVFFQQNPFAGEEFESMLLVRLGVRLHACLPPVLPVGWSRQAAACRLACVPAQAAALHAQGLSVARVPSRALPPPHTLQALVAEMVGNFSKRLEPYGVKVKMCSIPASGLPASEAAHPRAQHTAARPH